MLYFVSTNIQYKVISLAVVGNWDGSQYGRELKKRYGEISGYYLIDALYEPERLNALRSNCHLYIHGHSAGGTNPSLVEAMSLGLPVIAYDIPYNRATTENRALYFKDSNDLSRTVQNITEPERQKISRAMKQIATTRYTWHHITQKLTHALKKCTSSALFGSRLTQLTQIKLLTQ